MTEFIKNNQFINYLSIVDSIHDFGKKRCQDGVESGDSKYKDFIQYIKSINKSYEERDDYRKFTSSMFEGDYVYNWLEHKNVPIQTITGKNLFNKFKKIFNIGENEKYYTIHDAVYKNPVFNWNFKEGKTNSGDKYHVQIKIPHNSWDGATAATTKTFVSSKGRIVLPYNTNKKTWDFTSNTLTNRDNGGKMSFSYEKSDSFIYDIGPILRFKYIINGRKTTFKYESSVLSNPIEIKFNETGVILTNTSRGVLKKAKEQLNKFIKIFKKKKVQPQTYNVEKILDMEYVNKKPYYLVKWENYSDADNTWEPEVNLKGTGVIKAYKEGLYNDKTLTKLKGKIDAGPSVGSLCSVLLNKPAKSHSPCKSRDKDKLSITICEQIYNKLKGLKKSIEPQHLYNLLLDIKRSGDWEQVNSTKWYSGKFPKQKVVFFTGDWLCFLYAVINNINTVYIGTNDSITYYIKNTSSNLILTGGEKDETSYEAKYEESETNDDNDNIETIPYNEEGNIVDKFEKKENDDYDYDEDTDFDIELNILFMSVLSDIRNITMKWHSINDPEEQYYDMIRNIIIEFDEILSLFPETQTSIKKNVKSIIQLFSLILDIQTKNNHDNDSQNNILRSKNVNSPGNKFSQTYLKDKFEKIPNIEKYGYIGLVNETVESARTHTLKKIFLMSVCILYEMMTVDVNFDYENVNETINTDLIITDENIIPELPPILESLYYPILTNQIYTENEGKLSLFREDSIDNVIMLLGINYNLLAYRILNTSISDEDFNKEVFSLQGFYTGRSKNIVLKSFYDSYKLLVDVKDIPVENKQFIESARKFIGVTDVPAAAPPAPAAAPPAPPTLKRGRVEEQSEDHKKRQKLMSPTNKVGGKTKKRSKKHKKTKRKKISLPKSKKKTKKVRKKRNSKTKIKKKKYKKGKKKKKKQLFEMSIKELRDHVKKRKRNKRTKNI